MDNVQAYDAQAETIKVEDIATNGNNIIVLSRLQRNNDEAESTRHYGSKITTMRRGKVVLTTARKDPKIWDG